MKIDGRELASTFFSLLEKDVISLKKNDIVPHLIVILIGEDPASVAYVNQKKLKGENIGIKVTIKKFISTAKTEEILKFLNKINSDDSVHGIVIQQPAPPHIDINLLVESTNPKKDVDGFLKNSRFNEPIASAVEEILKYIFENAKSSKNESFISWLKNKRITVIGKGETGGTPIIKYLSKLKIPHTIIDSKTKDPDLIKKTSDIIISCVGKPNIITGSSIKNGVILISIGMFRGNDGKLHGDYYEEEIEEKAGFFTPVPGGVGPLNVAMLLKNTIDAAKLT